MFSHSMPHSNMIVLDRRKFLALAGTLAAAGLLPQSALALAGPYAFKQGAYDVTVVSDGTLSLNIASVFPGAPMDEVKKLLTRRSPARRRALRSMCCCSNPEATSS